MLVNKSGGKLVLGRINVKNGEALPGIPFTADERKGIEKLMKRGWVVEEKTETKPRKAEKAETPKVEKKVVETVINVETKAEEKTEEAVPAYAKYSRRKKKHAEDGGDAD